MKFIAGTFFVFLLIGLIYLSETNVVRKFEQEKLEPILEALFKDPDSRLHHQLFIINLKKLDIILAQYKNDGYLYTPSGKVFEKLLKHTNKYPFDFLAHKRFICILDRTQNTISKIILKQFLKQLDKYPTNYLVHGIFLKLIEKEPKMTSIIVYRQLINHLEKYSAEPLVKERLAMCVNKAQFLSPIFFKTSV